MNNKKPLPCDPKYTGPERRKPCNMLEKISEEVGELKQIQQEMKAEQKHVNDGVREMLEVWESLQGFVKVVNVLGKVAKWLVTVGIALGSIWVYLTHGGKNG